MAVRLTIFFLLLCGICQSQINVRYGKYFAHYNPPVSYTSIDNEEEFNGALSTSVNLKTKFSLWGDGIHDDTDSLIAMFKAIFDDHTLPNNFYLPNGIYNLNKEISDTLKQGHDNDGTGRVDANGNFLRLVASKVGVRIFGQNPDSTIIRWTGSDLGGNHSMLHLYGFAYSYMARITFDAGLKQMSCFEMGTLNGITNFDTGTKLEDMVFKNGYNGLRLGFTNYGPAELAMVRVKFINFPGHEAVITADPNAVDMWYEDCLFDGNAVAISNSGTSVLNSHGGNWQLLRCVFKNSTVAFTRMGSDVSVFSMDSCYGANDDGTTIVPFATNNLTNNAFQLSIRHCVFKKAFIYVAAQGQLLLLDNKMSNAALNPASGTQIIGFNAPVNTDTAGNIIGGGGNLTCMGNTWDYDPISDGVYQLTPYSKVLVIDNHKVSKTTVDTISQPVLPSAPQYVSRQVFEVYATTAVVQVQAKIDSAYALNGQKPIVHINESTTRTYQWQDSGVIVPSCDMQIRGDGHFGFSGTSLDGHAIMFNGTVIYTSGTAFTFDGNGSKVQFSDIKIVGDGTNEGIVIKGADKVGDRITMEGYEGRNASRNTLLVDGLKNSMVFVWHSGFSYGLPGSRGVYVKGANDSAGTAKTYVSYSVITHQPDVFDVSNKGNLEVSYNWNEANGSVSPYTRFTGSGKFLSWGGLIKSDGSTDNTRNVVATDSVDATYAGLDISDAISVEGSGWQSNVLSLTNVFHTPPYFIKQTTSGIAKNINSSKTNFGNNSTTFNNTGASEPADATDKQFILDRIAEFRQSETPRFRVTPTINADIRFKRFWVTGCWNNVVVRPR